MSSKSAVITRIAIGVGICAALVFLDPAVAQERGNQVRGLVEPAPTPKPINYDALTQEAVSLLQRYVRINTTNPPGNELVAAKMLREKFLADGIPATVWEPAPGRGIVAARLRGTGRHTKALVLLSHM